MRVDMAGIPVICHRTLGPGVSTTRRRVGVAHYGSEITQTEPSLCAGLPCPLFLPDAENNGGATSGNFGRCKENPDHPSYYPMKGE